ncbi:transcription factor e(y)2 domain-containing protein [Ditylenchus destructor]|uniref:Transcription and mRNA export factor ENY2 n=1 Tax=Ditylenchus destructor TaxID=166010 RepID=A0AAD4NFB5_9BILA|nr:transcription factor e(y)2 domain-containing protein [Ditylenchus destructor]
MSVDSSSTSKRLNTKDEMEHEFIQSGEKQRLQEIMTKRLKETGWVSKVEGICKDYIESKGVERASVDDLIAEVRDQARRSVPDDVKKELMEHVQKFVYDHTDLSPDK